MTESEIADSIRSGLAAEKRGEVDAAERHYRDALAKAPRELLPLKLLARLAAARGDRAEAESLLARARVIAPDDADVLHLDARACLSRGDWHGARERLERLLAREPASVAALVDLALCSAKLGAWQKSKSLAERAVALAPEDVDAWRALAQACRRLRAFDEALAAYDRILRRAPGDHSVWYASSVMLLRAGRAVDAHERASRAVELAPSNVQYRRHQRSTAAAAVPPWHFDMMNDELRNELFAQAIAARVTPETLVLEIGTGSGLLAMLAARDGARRVVTCEGNRSIAAAASRIIAANGLSERVRVVAKHSTELVVGAELPERADLLISEIFSVQVIAEGVLQSLEDAKARLLKPGATILPARAVARGALIGGQGLERLVRVGTVKGFDLSAFNEFTPTGQYMSPGQRFDWLSEPVDLMRFDFRGASRPATRHDEVALKVTETGVCEGVLQWLRLEIDDERAYEVVPDAAGAAREHHWLPIWYPFRTPLSVRAGEQVRLGVSHNSLALLVELAGA